MNVFNLYWWKDFYYTQISSRIWPRQWWLISKIPRTWRDKDTLMEIVILECIKNYVEGEGALDNYESSQNDPSYPDWQKKFDKEVKENYDLIKEKLPKFEREMEEAWSKVPKRDLKDINNTRKIDYKTVYGEVDRLEKEIFDLKTKIMLWAINNRASIWT